MKKPEDYGITQRQLDEYLEQKDAYERALEKAKDKRRICYNVSIIVFAVLMIVLIAVSVAVGAYRLSGSLCGGLAVGVWLWLIFKARAINNPKGYFPRYPEKYKTGFIRSGRADGHIDIEIESKCLKYLNAVERKGGAPAPTPKSAPVPAVKKKPFIDVMSEVRSVDVDLGDFSASELCDIGWILYNNDKPKVAVKYFSFALRKGDKSAAGILGYCYEKGEGVVADYGRAAAYYKIAAEDGDASAAYNLALLYERGMGVIADNGEAKAWYKVAAERGDKDAKAELKRINREDERKKLFTCPACGGLRKVVLGAAVCPKCGTIKYDDFSDIHTQEKYDFFGGPHSEKNELSGEFDFEKNARADFNVSVDKKNANKFGGAYPDTGDKYDFSRFVRYLRNDADFGSVIDKKSPELKAELSRYEIHA